MTIKNRLIGRKVIVRSNDYSCPYWTGTYQGKDPTAYDVPIVIRDDGERYLVMGIIIPHSERLAQWLDTMTPKEQWETLLGIKRFWDAMSD